MRLILNHATQIFQTLVTTITQTPNKQSVSTYTVQYNSQRLGGLMPLFGLTASSLLGISANITHRVRQWTDIHNTCTYHLS